MRKKKGILTKAIGKVANLFGRGSYKYLKDIKGVIHVGANTGQERRLYQKFNLNVLWIEPIPVIFEKLKENIKAYNNQIAVKALVTDKNNMQYKFNIANNNGASSSILILEKHKDIWPEVFYEDSILINSVTLERLIEKEHIDIKNYQALVLDTQGSELLVLKGSMSLLKHFKYIAIEVADFESYKDCCTLIDISEFMKSQNFEESFRSKFAESTNGGSYYDILFKRRD